MNKAILIGNLTRDPESKTTSSGIPWATFTLAVNRRFVNQQGVREADFLNCVAWRQQAEFVSRYLTKGTRVAVEGTIQTRSYDAQDGSKRYVTEIIVENVEFTGPRSDGQARENIPAPSAPPAYNQPAFNPPPTDTGSFQGGAPQGTSKGFTEVEDDELPF